MWSADSGQPLLLLRLSPGPPARAGPPTLLAAGQRCNRENRAVINDTVFTVEATPIKFGAGAAEDAGWELERLGATRVLVVSDPGVVAAGVTGCVRERIEAAGIATELFDDIHVEPTLESVTRAAEAAVQGGYDGFVGLGGGSSLDTAKVADLIATHGGEVMDYVNAPVGWGLKPPAPLKPLLAMPTTPGSGSEA